MGPIRGSAPAAPAEGVAALMARAPEGPPDMTDDQYRSALEELRAHPDRFVTLATLPWVDAWSAANELWRHGIGAVFVPRDDALAPADPGCTGAGADDGRDRDDDDQPPPGLERVRGGSVQPWLRPNQPLIADAVLYVPAAHETEARAIAGRRLGIL